MLVTLIPLFDENLSVSAYSLFAQKHNYLLRPELLGSGGNDGASRIDGLEILEHMGIETLADNLPVFVSIGNISIFSDIAAQCKAPRDRIVLLIDNSIPPIDMYLDRLDELKAQGFELAIRNLPVSVYESYHEIFKRVAYVMIDTQLVDVTRARLFYDKMYPHIKLISSNIKSMKTFERIKDNKCCAMFEGSFYRLPVTKGSKEIAPLKINYIELMNIVNAADFDLTKAADVIGQDTSLTISLLEMVNRMTINSEITSIRHAAAMLGQIELKRWINTAVVKELCADRPSEVTRLSLLRAKFSENLAKLYDIGGKSSELFLMGLFSVLDIILEKPMDEALQLVKLSRDIEQALIGHTGELYDILDFVVNYESANWQEVSRLMVLKDIGLDDVDKAYTDSLKWYRQLVSIKV